MGYVCITELLSFKSGGTWISSRAFKVTYVDYSPTKDAFTLGLWQKASIFRQPRQMHASLCESETSSWVSNAPFQTANIIFNKVLMCWYTFLFGRAHAQFFYSKSAVMAYFLGLIQFFHWHSEVVPNETLPLHTTSIKLTSDSSTLMLRCSGHENVRQNTMELQFQSKECLTVNLNQELWMCNSATEYLNTFLKFVIDSNMWGSRGRVVSTMTTMRSEQLRYWPSVRGRDKIFLSLRKFPDRLWSPNIRLFSEYRGLVFREIKRPQAWSQILIYIQCPD